MRTTSPWRLEYSIMRMGKLEKQDAYDTHDVEFWQCMTEIQPYFSGYSSHNALEINGYLRTQPRLQHVVCSRLSVAKLAA